MSEEDILIKFAWLVIKGKIDITVAYEALFSDSNQIQDYLIEG